MLAAVFTLATFWIFFPGFVSNDSIHQLSQARGTLTSDGHPPIMSLLWRVADFFVRGQTGMMFIQIFLYWMVIILIFTSIIPAKSAIIFSIIIGLFPPYFLLVGVIWKDIYLNIVLMLLSYITIAYSNRVGEWSRPRQFILFITPILILCVLAIMFRHNAIFAVLAFIIFGIYKITSERTQYRVVLSVLVSVPIIFSVFGIANLFNRSVVERPASLLQVLAAFDVAGITYFSYEHQRPREHIVAVFGEIDNKIVVDKYNSCDAFPIFVTAYSGESIFEPTLDPRRIQEIESAWMDLIFELPLSYLRHRISVFGCSLGIGTPGPWYAPIFFYIGPEAARVEIAWSGPSVAQRYVIKFGTWMTGTFVYKPYVYALICIVVIGVALFMGARWLSYAVVALSGLTYQAGYALIGVSTEFRYYTWLILAGCVASAAMGASRWHTRSS